MAVDAAIAKQLLSEVRGRGEIKRLGERIDEDGELREAVLAIARQVDPDIAADAPGKRIVKVALARSDEAQIRTNPIHRDEPFVCAHCGFAVPPHGRTARDHCPRCLRSLHVDVVPGDRAADCGGVLDPRGMQIRGGRELILYRCRKCGAESLCTALCDGEVPDSPEARRAVSQGADPWPR